MLKLEKHFYWREFLRGPFEYRNASWPLLAHMVRSQWNENFILSPRKTVGWELGVVCFGNLNPTQNAIFTIHSQPFRKYPGEPASDFRTLIHSHNNLHSMWMNIAKNAMLTPSFSQRRKQFLTPLSWCCLRGTNSCRFIYNLVLC